MNRIQRRVQRQPSQKSSNDQEKSHYSRSDKEQGRLTTDVEELLSPKMTRQSSMRSDRLKANRCCTASPELQDFGQIAEGQLKLNDEYKSLLMEQYGFEPDVSKNIRTKDMCSGTMKVDFNSRCVNTDCKIQLSAYAETTDSMHWQKIDNVDDIEKFLILDKKVPEHVESPIILPQNVHISEVPRIKTIAEKFSKFKKNDIELRQLDEKVVCIEYDIYDKTSMGDSSKPMQIMRAYFSVKPSPREPKERPIVNDIISNIRNKFNITDDESKVLKKEIEVIDANSKNNKSYLDDLRRVLKRKRAIYNKKNKTSLDLQSLFEMAKRETPILDDDFSDTNLLSKAELEEVKELILKTCVSSVHGITRRKIMCQDEVANNDNLDFISPSFVKELLREVGEC